MLGRDKRAVQVESSDFQRALALILALKRCSAGNCRGEWISNQKQTGGKFDPAAPPKKVVTWQKKLGHIAEAIGAPMLIFAALADDYYRKPALGMWHATLAELDASGGEKSWVCVEPGYGSSSFYVGDAAGRTKGKGREADHNDTDRKWALNAGLPFYTPEEWFMSSQVSLASRHG